MSLERQEWWSMPDKIYETTKYKKNYENFRNFRGYFVIS